MFAGLTEDARASCRSGEDLTGGGVDFPNSFGFVSGLAVVESAPSFGDSWHATVSYESGSEPGHAGFTVYAVCLER